MADKTTTLYEPVKNDVRHITIVYEDGVASSVEISAAVRASDANIRYSGNAMEPADSFSESVKKAFADLATEAAGKIASKKGFV